MDIRQVTLEDAEQLVPLLEQLRYKFSLAQMRTRILSFNRDLHQALVAEQHKV